MCRFLLQGIVFVLAFCRTNQALCAAMSSSSICEDRERDTAWQAYIQQGKEKRAAEAQAAVEAFPVADAAVAAQMRQDFEYAQNVLEQEERQYFTPSWKVPWCSIGKMVLWFAAFGTFAWWLQSREHNFQKKLVKRSLLVQGWIAGKDSEKLRSILKKF